MEYATNDRALNFPRTRVTDVLLDGELFSEIYPHQAEDVDLSGIERIEIKSVSTQQMSEDIIVELSKVIQLMHKGSTLVAELFRQAEDAEALEVYQDLLDVTRQFIAMITLVQEQVTLPNSADFKTSTDDIIELFSEMTEVLANEDWMLMADLLEYEYPIIINKWERMIENFEPNIVQAA